MAINRLHGRRAPARSVIRMCRKTGATPRRRRLIAFALAAVVLIVGVSVRHAPIYLPRIDTPPAPAEAVWPVFGYATLESPVIRFLVAGRVLPGEPAVLEGYRKEARNIIPADGARVHGRLFEVTPEVLTRIDRYERRGIRYERTLLPLEDGRHVWVYRRLD